MKKLLVVIVTTFIFVLAVFSLFCFHFIQISNDIDKKFKMNGKDQVVIKIGDTYQDEGYYAEEYNEYVKTYSNLDLNKVGSYEIVYMLDFNKLKKKYVRKVNIVDLDSPTIELLNCADDSYMFKGDKIKYCDYETTDNYDSDIQDRVTIDSKIDNKKKGDYVVKYIVTDSSGNTDEKSVTVHVRDKWDMNYIVITISKQKLEYYQMNKKVLETPVTTGRNNATRTGKFKIRNKTRNTQLKGKDYVSEVKYWMAYDGNNFGIHDASWRSNFGSMSYKTTGSHGCVNVPTKAMKKLYEMVEIGTPVYIKK